MNRTQSIQSHSYKLAAVTRSHPDPVQVSKGIFNHRSLRSLYDLGVDVTAIAPRPHAPPVGPFSELTTIPNMETYGYPVHYPRFMYLLPKKLFKYTLTRWSFNRVTHDVLNNICSDIDIIHAAHIYFDGYAVATYTDDTDVPFTVTCHGTILNNYYDASARVQSIVEFVLKRASKIFCVSDALVDIAADLVGEEKVHLVPIGADPNRFPVDSRLQLRSDNGVPSSKPLVLFCGSCSYLKGIDQLIELLPTIEESGAHLAVVSDGGNKESALLNAVERQELEDEVHIRWNVPPERVSEWFAIADVLVLPSRSEGRPTVIYEAMASKTPVVAYSVGGIPEQIVDKETGLLVSPLDIEELQSELKSLLEEPDTMAQMGRNARSCLVESGWTWENHAQTVISHHCDLL